LVVECLHERQVPRLAGRPMVRHWRGYRDHLGAVDYQVVVRAMREMQRAGLDTDSTSIGPFTRVDSRLLELLSGESNPVGHPRRCCVSFHAAAALVILP
jgi:hypothetical protein